MTGPSPPVTRPKCSVPLASATSSTAGRPNCPHEPAVLLMDEPFSSLDELTGEVLRRELLQLWQATGTTVLFVSHSVPEAVLLSDEVVVMTHAPGRVAALIEVSLERPRGDLVEVSDAFRDVEREVRLALRSVMRDERPAS